MRKDIIIKNVKDMEYVEELLKLSYSKNLDVYFFDGSLLDDIVIINEEKAIVINGKKREYIILKEKYVSAWSSCYDVILTDNYDSVREFTERRENEEE